jgi:hypothetical protein
MGHGVCAKTGDCCSKVKASVINFLSGWYGTSEAHCLPSKGCISGCTSSTPVTLTEVILGETGVQSTNPLGEAILAQPEMKNTPSSEQATVVRRK